MEENLEIIDESNDKKYFSLLPHYILNHSTAVDQALYMQMKRYAGESKNGECWASKNTLQQKLGVGEKALNKSIKYLLSRGWIFEKGWKEVETRGGKQKVRIYGIRDIWKLNIEFYEGGVQSDHLEHKGGVESSSKVVSKVDEGGAKSRPNKNHIKQEPYINKNNSLALKKTFSEFENVKLTDEELEKLKSRLGNDAFTLIDELGSYIASTGKRYSSHYATILNWAKRKGTNFKAKKITII